MSIHHLKIQRQPFEDLVSGRKTGEVRNCADREFREGDHVELLLIDETGNPANKSIVRTITHIQRGYGLPDDICVLSYAAPVVERQPVAQKYDDTLLPFVALMRKELHSNDSKGDRPGWLAMSADTCLLEIIYHFGKLQASVKRGDGDGINEYAADVSNMCMMLTDICGSLAYAEITAPPELAELQATIARLTVENEQSNDWEGLHAAMQFQRDHWRSKAEAMTAEIERLKGGQGETVGRVSYIGSGFVRVRTTECLAMEQPLYTSQPAPISVVLPSHQEIHVLISKAARQADLTAGANYFTAAEFSAIALLDKVKELNQ